MYSEIVNYVLRFTVLFSKVEKIYDDMMIIFCIEVPGYGLHAGKSQMLQHQALILQTMYQSTK